MAVPSYVTALRVLLLAIKNPTINTLSDPEVVWENVKGLDMGAFTVFPTDTALCAIAMVSPFC